jgi:hypothetical protein
MRLFWCAAIAVLAGCGKPRSAPKPPPMQIECEGNINGAYPDPDIHWLSDSDKGCSLYRGVEMGLFWSREAKDGERKILPNSKKIATSTAPTEDSNTSNSGPVFSTCSFTDNRGETESWTEVGTVCHSDQEKRIKP